MFDSFLIRRDFYSSDIDINGPYSDKEVRQEANIARNLMEGKIFGEVLIVRIYTSSMGTTRVSLEDSWYTDKDAPEEEKYNETQG